jgi:hypothetical protein
MKWSVKWGLVASCFCCCRYRVMYVERESSSDSTSVNDESVLAGTMRSGSCGAPIPLSPRLKLPNSPSLSSPLIHYVSDHSYTSYIFIHLLIILILPHSL